MKNLFKNIFRYSLKNKSTIICLLLIFLICIISILTLGFLTHNLVSVYNNVLRKTNLHEIVINEKFDSSDAQQAKKQELINKLETDLNVQVRPFESMNIITSDSNKYKIIKYDQNYKFDNLYVFDQNGLPIVNDLYTIPNNINFSDIIYYAQNDLINHTVANNNNIKARQTLVYFASKASWNNIKYKNSFTNLLQYIIANNNFDPISSSNDPNINQSIEWLKGMIDPNNNAYTPIINKDYRLIFKIPNTTDAGYYDDYNSYLTIVSPTYLKYNNKKIFPYVEYQKMLNMVSSIDNNTISTEQFSTIFNNISDEYKIYVESIPYLIVGTGLTPDFTYPIISYENVVVDFKKEVVTYVNNGGYARAQNSWATAPQENLILVKLKNNDNPNILLKQINELATPYVGFPDGDQVAFFINDENNIYSPTGLRVRFLSDLVLAIRLITVFLTIFLIIISIIVLTIILNKFIKQNIKSLYIIIANGLSKFKAISSVLIITILPIFISTIIGYIIAHFIQIPVANIFSNYWSLPFGFMYFNPAWMLLIGAILIILCAIVIYSVCYICLRHNVAIGINYNELKLGWFSRIMKKPLWFANVLVKFRTSIAFSSITKLFLLTFVSTLLLSAISFIFSTQNDFNNAINISLKSNTSNFQIDLETPTVQGGQYYAANYNQIGTTLYNGQKPVNESETLKNSVYKNLYNKNDLFKNWSNLHYVSINDLNEKNNNINFTYNKVEIQFMMNVFLGLNSMGQNPWKSLVEILVPPNVYNASSQYQTELFEKLIMDNKIVNIYNPNQPSYQYYDKTLLNNINNNMGLPGLIYNNEILLTNDENILFDINNDNSYSKVLYINENIDLITKDIVYNNLKTKVYSKTNTPFTIDSFNIIVHDNNKYITFNNDFNTITNRQLVWYLYNPTIFDKQEINIQKQLIVNDNLTLKDYILNLTSSKINNIYKLSDNFINWVLNIITDKYYQKFLYKICYNWLPYNEKNGDELYVYIDGKLLSSLNTKYQINNNIKIVGINKDSKFIHLYDSNGVNINNSLFTNNNSDEIPMIINQYAAKKYNLNINDIISVKSINHVERYLSNPNINKYTKKYKIVGISSGKKDDEFYISINNAQDALGLYNPVNTNTTNTQVYNNPYRPLNNMINQGFNGIFLKDNFELLTSSCSLYANSGLYPGIDTFEKSVELNDLISYTLNNFAKLTNLNDQTNINLRNFEQLLIALDFDLYNQYKNNKQQYQDNIKNLITNNQLSIEIEKIINKFNQIYGLITYNSILSKPNSFSTTLNAFNEITNTVLTLEYIVVSLLTVLSIIILFTLGIIIITDLLKVIVLLKVLGFSNKQNAINIFSIFIPTWILSFLITIPISYGMLYIFKEFVFVKMGILISATLNWPALIVSLLSLGLIFGAIIIMVAVLLKKINLNDSLKW